jgi:GTPase SAR1 family protein
VPISSDLYMLPTNTQTLLIDSSGNEQEMAIQIEHANVIILVYDVNNVECFKRIKTYWIGFIKKISDKVSTQI